MGQLNWKSNEGIVEFIRESKALTLELTDFFKERNVSPEMAEAVMLLLAGISKGLRMSSLRDDIEPLAIGWQMAAELGS